MLENNKFHYAKNMGLVGQHRNPVRTKWLSQSRGYVATKQDYIPSVAKTLLLTELVRGL